MPGRVPLDLARRTSWGLALLVTLFCLLGAIYSVTVPLFEAPDEIWHFAFIRTLATQRSLPVQPTEGKDTWLREAGQPPLYHLLAALLVAPLDTSDFPDFVRFNLAHPAVTAGAEGETPNVFIHTPHEAFPYRGSVLAVHVVRLFSVLWGAGAIVAAYLVAREVVPDRPVLALAAAALVALNPHFIFISSVVNNDATAACLCTLVLWLAVRLARERGASPVPGLASASALGALLGLCLLSKLSALASLPLAALALGLLWWRERDVRALLVRSLVVFGLAALVAAWWYVRNWLLYGDVLGWSVWLIDIGVHRIALAELLRQFGHVATSFWAPYDHLFPRWVFWALGLLLIVAVAGWVRLIAQLKARATTKADGLLLSGAWFVLLFISLIRYMTTTPSAEGRLLFPGIASAALLLVLGWDALLPRRWARQAVGVVGAGLLALSVACPFLAIAPRYALPLVSRVRELEGMVPLEGGDWEGVRLLGVCVEPREAQAGQPLDIALYWEALDVPPADLRAVVRVWTVGERLLGQWDGVPAGEVYPPDLWRAGDVVRDDYNLRAYAGGPAMYRVSVGVRQGDRGLGSASSPAAFKLAPTPLPEEAIAQPLAYRLGDRIALIGYSLAKDPPPPQDGLPVTLYWRALAEMDEDYTVFVHLLYPDGTLAGQGDGPPLGGDYPTASWSPGEELADVHIVRLKEADASPPLPAGSYLLVGLYRLADGMRLPAHTEAGQRVPHDAIQIDLGL